jgi:hypothetical protein
VRGLLEKEPGAGRFRSGTSWEANRCGKGSRGEVKEQAAARCEVPKATAYGFVYHCDFVSFEGNPSPLKGEGFYTKLSRRDDSPGKILPFPWLLS